MEQKKQTIFDLPTRRDSGKDLDDLIFSGEGWQISDR